MYYYPKSDVMIDDDTGKVNSIIIYDRNFGDQNNIKVGYSERRVEEMLKYKTAERYIKDIYNIIMYWFDIKDNKVSKIVLAH